MSTICVYGAASDRINDEYITDTERLGALIAENGYKMIYGGGSSGLMGAAARGMAEHGGYVIGVTPHFMHTYETLNKNCTETIETNDMAARKNVMESRAAAFVVVPGGVGTFDEFFQIVTLKELGRLGDKPIILLNTLGYYNELYAMMRAANDKGFFRPEIMGLFTMVDTPEQALEELNKQLSEVKKGK